MCSQCLQAALWGQWLPSPWPYVMLVASCCCPRSLDMSSIWEESFWVLTLHQHRVLSPGPLTFLHDAHHDKFCASSVTCPRSWSFGSVMLPRHKTKQQPRKLTVLWVFAYLVLTQWLMLIFRRTRARKSLHTSNTDMVPFLDICNP